MGRSQQVGQTYVRRGFTEKSQHSAEVGNIGFRGEKTGHELHDVRFSEFKTGPRWPSEHRFGVEMLSRHQAVSDDRSLSTLARRELTTVAYLIMRGIRFRQSRNDRTRSAVTVSVTFPTLPPTSRECCSKHVSQREGS